MSNDYPIERLLRPVVEYNAATASGMAAGLSFVAPSYWMMTEPVSYVCTGVLGFISYKYLDNALRLSNYQKNVKTLKPYVIAACDVPVSEDKSFIGLGYRWQSIHTQRLYDTYKPENEHFIRPPKYYDWARRKESQWENKFCLSVLAKGLKSDNFLNPFKAYPDIGGNAAIHGVGADEEENVFWNLGERNGHALVLGTTRVGKTRFEEVLVAGDIRRKGKGGDNVVIVIDPKGDAELFKRMYTEAKRAGREDDFYFFHLGYPEASCRYNPVGEFQRITEVAGKTTSQLGEAGNSAAFKAFSWRFVNVVARALVDVNKRPTLENINHYVQDLEDLLYMYCVHALKAVDDDPADLIAERASKVKDRDPMVERKGKTKNTVAIVALMKELLPNDNLGRQLIMASNYERSFYEKLVASLIPFLDKLNTDKTAKLLSPEYFNDNDPRPILSWRDVIQRRGIVYIGLDGMTDREVATAVGNAMFNDLVSIAGLMYKHGKNVGLPSLNGSKELKMPDIYLHADEFNSLVGEEFVPMVNQAGGAGIRVCAYTQTLQDIDAKFGTTTGNPKSMQIVGNFNTLFMMRVQTEETASLLTSKLPKVPIKEATLVSGASKKLGNDIGGFDDTNQDRISEEKVPLVEPTHITSLSKGHAFCLQSGNQLWKVRLPLFSKKESVELPPTLQDICTDMNERYQTGDLWWTGASNG
ncbi:type IV conjugative transfer system coupling protein TraD [Pseudoalteromonas distincta]|uniref:type IV conjugative transfer system coupling protein TraD n=1 Tax=Pseudoalteromonas TaxID=53246 RepID=UPI000C341106|nr:MULTISPECIES: type IV conjugative transfer system coupling protein TraD [Pseudoalteromonas]PKG68603.1 conjugative coupling factor TraD, PFGI-1 class [Pseudoalteromonas sp. GutCa3]TVU70388.1 type IV conjugative transfer system coupling protein TraD [Pseudoalteromonas elyakovii]